MKVFDIEDSEGRALAIGVANVGISREGVVRILRSVPGVRIVASTRLYSRTDEFCEFEIAGVRFRAWEPSGDGSRYWIGTSPARFVEQFASVRAAFVRYVPPRGVTVPRFVALALVALGLPACLAFRTLRPSLSSLGFGAFMIGGLLLTVVVVIARGCPGVSPENDRAEANLKTE